MDSSADTYTLNEVDGRWENGRMRRREQTWNEYWKGGGGRGREWKMIGRNRSEEREEENIIRKSIV